MQPPAPLWICLPGLPQGQRAPTGTQVQAVWDTSGVMELAL